MDTKQCQYVEAVSAWYDGESVPEWEAMRDAALADPATRERWGTYALIGAALRGEALRLPNDGFVDALLMRLANEVPEATASSKVPEQPTSGNEPMVAANDPYWQWGAVAALVIAVAVGWFIAAPPSLPLPMTALAPSRSDGAKMAPLLGLSQASGSLRPVASGGSTNTGPIYLSVHNPLQPVHGWPQRRDGSLRPAVSERAHR
jgi:hypothetical protein